MKRDDHVWEAAINFVTCVNGILANFPEEKFDFFEI